MPRLSSEQLAIGVVFVAIFVLASMTPAKSDLWWLMRSGQEIVQTGHVPMTESYSYTARGRHWPNHEWLTELLLYATHRFGGMPLLAALSTALILAAWSLSWRLMSGRFEMKLVLFALSLTSAASAWGMRPQLISMLLFSTTCWLLVSKRFWWLPPLMALWANLHGAAALGLVAIWAALAAEILAVRGLPVSFASVAVVSTLATAVSPIGFGLWRHWIGHSQQLTTYPVQEWLPPAAPPDHFAFWIIALALAIAVASRWQRLNPRAVALAAIALGMLPLALSSVRNVAVFLLAAVPALSAALTTLPVFAQPPPAKDQRAGNTVILAAIGVVAVAFVGSLWSNPTSRLNWEPIAADVAAAVNRCRGPLYNTYEDGGPLTWSAQNQPVFIDNRYDPYPITLIMASYEVERTGAYAALFREFGIQCALVPVNSATSMGLRKDPSWQLMHADQRHAVYERRP